MNGRTYSYRTPAAAMLALTMLLIASIAPLFIAGADGFRDKGAVLFALVWAALPGLYGLRILLSFLFERVVLGHDEIWWFDWLGRMKAHAHFGQIQGAVAAGATAVNYTPIKLYEILTDNGKIHFSSLIWDCTGLFNVADKVSIRNKPVQEGVPQPPFHGFRAFSYMGPLPVIFGLLFFGAGIAAMVGINMAAMNHAFKVNGQLLTDPSFANMLPWELFCLVFIVVGLFVIVWANNTAVIISGNTISYRNWLKRITCHARLDQIREIREEAGSKGSTNYRIVTDEGDILVYQNLRGWDELSAIIKNESHVGVQPKPQSGFNSPALGFALLLIQVVIFLFFALSWMRH